MIKAPAWVASQGGVPTEKGWKHPDRNEILLPKKFTQAQINEYMNVSNCNCVDCDCDPCTCGEKEVTEEVVQLNEAPANNTSLEDMSKVELEALGREHGVELDRRKTKTTLVERMKGIIGR
jgi:hypothetical protein